MAEAEDHETDGCQGGPSACSEDLGENGVVTGLEHDRQNQDIVASTLKMAHDLGFTVIAEGVEQESTVTMLEEMGCDVLQGYALAEPMPEASLLIWCQDNPDLAAVNA